MPAVWLGENSVPVLREASPGVFEFGFYRKTSPRTRVVWFLVFFLMATLIAGPGIVLSFGNGYAFTLITGFYLLWLSLSFVAIFRSADFRIDTRQRSFTRRRFLCTWNVQTSVWKLCDGDAFTVYLARDEHGAGADHRVYLTSNGIDQYLFNVHLPVACESSELQNWLDDLADRLGIVHQGYGSSKTYFRRLLTPRF